MSVLKAKLIYNNSYEDCDYRLSPTSKAFCETYNTGKEWYEFIPEFDYLEMAKVDEKNGDKSLTTDFAFVKPLYIKFNFDYEKLKKEWDNLTKTAPKTYNNLPVIIANFPSKDELEKEIFKTFLKEKIKTIQIINNGDVFAIIRAKKNQTFPFEKISGVDNFDEFEKFVKDFYQIPNYKLIYPEGHENSPTEYWRMKKYDYTPFIKEKDGFTFIDEKFLKFVEKEENKKWLNAVKKNLETILKAKKFDELDHKTTSITYNERLINEYSLNELNDLLEKAKQNYEKLQKEYITEKVKNFIQKADEFLKYGLYKIDSKLQSPDIDFSKEELEKIKDNEKLYKKATKMLETLKNIETIYTKAGTFYVNLNDKVWNMEIPDNKKGLFIGKGGQNIKELTNRYDVKINIVNNNSPALKIKK